MIRVFVATTNSDKVHLLQPYMREYGYQLVPCSPGNGEQEMPIGYESAAIGKVLEARNMLQQDEIPILSLDSGYEFSDLNGYPGPLSRRALKDGSLDMGTLHMGCRVKVVHCIAILWKGRCGVFTHSDERELQSRILQSSRLPMSSLLKGPMNALPSCVADVNCWLESTQLALDYLNGKNHEL